VLKKDRIYDPEKFHGRVKHFPFYDHNAPPVHLIVECCNDIYEWLDESGEHIAGVHCKAGKGRTGLISCCFLMLNGTCKNSDEALIYYGNKRTKDGKGVTIASQIRYIRYYEKVLKELEGNIPESIPLVLTRVRISYYPKKEIKISGDPYILIEINDVVVHTSEAGTVEKVKKGGYKADIKVMGMVQGDVKIILQVKKGSAKQKLCHFWFNSGFIEDMKLDLPKKEIDVANKDKNCKIFKEEFNIECFFKEPDPDDDVPALPEPEEDVEEDNSKEESIEENNKKKIIKRIKTVKSHQEKIKENHFMIIPTMANFKKLLIFLRTKIQMLERKKIMTIPIK